MIFLKLKTIILIICALLIVFLIKDSNYIIPKESIRIRIISNSNRESDVKNKYKIQKNVEEKLYLLLKDAKSVKNAKEIINNNLDYLNDYLKEISKTDYKISFGNNYFPRKEYKGVVYEEGNYDSIVITLGNGSGDNWWCVLFPPLCLLDENTNTKDVEYKIFVKELIKKYLK